MDSHQILIFGIQFDPEGCQGPLISLVDFPKSLHLLLVFLLHRSLHRCEIVPALVLGVQSAPKFGYFLQPSIVRLDASLAFLIGVNITTRNEFESGVVPLLGLVDAVLECGMKNSKSTNGTQCHECDGRQKPRRCRGLSVHCETSGFLFCHLSEGTSPLLRTYLSRFFCSVFERDSNSTISVWAQHSEASSTRHGLQQLGV
mmetsp:Transcript_14373/g.36119  ORF Transcript_14373/g.36119 Transcript_14373/m.36119 type:complete len:201 (+) Transcript_14373:1760-2362(+)